MKHCIAVPCIIPALSVLKLVYTCIIRNHTSENLLDKHIHNFTGPFYCTYTHWNTDPKAHESLNSMVPYRCFKGLSLFPVKILPKFKMFFF